ncbi:ejaculatory bulb-specific protein 3-like [Macrosteles quadrilineatus]|uniref:ejaculatory bulb-specific protein 3-like n=1 Tax=Macrosteles quadrilineatus TaxID=74068 RepID=UPI0023E3250A|nr:ejaculatory bulb-specific protein 3-like [Macrosteles quadrilineatus]
MYAVVLLAIVALAAAEDGYTTKFDNVDIDSILQNDRLLKNYFNCLMDKGPCTADGNELKKNLPESLENNCAKCSEKQRANSERVLKYIYKNKPDMFKELESKYDPNNKYRKLKESIEGEE